MARALPPGAKRVDFAKAITQNSSQPPSRVGQRIAERLEANQDTELVLTSGDRHETCLSASLQSRLARRCRIQIGLPAAQRLADLPPHQHHRIARSGSPQRIDEYVSSLQKQFPDSYVRPLRPILRAQAKNLLPHLRPAHRRNRAHPHPHHPLRHGRHDNIAAERKHDVA